MKVIYQWESSDIRSGIVVDKGNGSQFVICGESVKSEGSEDIWYVVRLNGMMLDNVLNTKGLIDWLTNTGYKLVEGKKVVLG